MRGSTRATGGLTERLIVSAVGRQVQDTDDGERADRLAPVPFHPGFDKGLSVPYGVCSVEPWLGMCQTLAIVIGRLQSGAEGAPAGAVRESLPGSPGSASLVWMRLSVPRVDLPLTKTLAVCDATSSRDRSDVAVGSGWTNPPCSRHSATVRCSSSLPVSENRPCMGCFQILVSPGMAFVCRASKKVYAT